MRIVLDANVLVAAFAARGLCADIFEVCLAEHVLATSEAILEETHRALQKKVRLPRQRAVAIRAFLRERHEVVEPAAVPDDACRDRDDLAVLGTAVAATADCIVSGDGDLLSLVSFSGIPVLSPRALWELLRRPTDPRKLPQKP